tara:strand:+ start:598 stop:702 length:105 start_codon:yes stop_codon:yes gene_type:complete
MAPDTAGGLDSVMDKLFAVNFQLCYSGIPVAVAS